MRREVYLFILVLSICCGIRLSSAQQIDKKDVSVLTPNRRSLQMELALRDAPSLHEWRLSRAKLLRCQELGSKHDFLDQTDKLLSYYQSQGAILYTYDTWCILCDFYLDQGDYTQAIVATHQMKNHAAKHNQNFGLAMSSYCFGKCYLQNRLFYQAERCFREAYDKFLQERSYDHVISAGLSLIEIYRQRNSEAALTLCDSLTHYISVLGQEQGAVRSDLRCRQAAAYVKILSTTRGGVEQASAYCDTMLSFNSLNHPKEVRKEVLQAHYLFMTQAGNHQEAQKILSELIQAKEHPKDSLSYLIRFYRSSAEVASQAGKPQEACLAYRKYVSAVNLAARQNIERQHEVMAQLYQLREREYDRECDLIRGQQLWLLGSCVLLFILLLGSILYFGLRHLHRKNIELVRLIRLQEASESKGRHCLQQEIPSREEQLFKQIEDLFDNNELLANPSLGRDELAMLLGTNRTYIADAIRVGTQGQSVSEYINEKRVRYALKLIEAASVFSADAIADACGFNSRSTFFRVFRYHYMISPGEYHRIIQQK